jgi:polyhydroxybutyrate depolymerase
MKHGHLFAVIALVTFGIVSAPAEAATKHRTRTTVTHTTKHVKKTRKHTRTVKKTATRPAPAVAARPQPSTDTQAAINRPGDYSFAIQHDGRTRTYRVHVPPGYSPSEPAPLIVALRPGGADAQDDGFHGLTREADRQGFVTVFPDALRSGTAASWNAGTCCGNGTARANDVGFIETVVNNVFRQVSIARLRIYAAGMSDGGMMAYRLACELPHVFTAVASVAGTDNTAQCAPDKPVSVLHLHARNDPRVPYDGLANAKGPALASVSQTSEKWAKLDGCMETPQPVLDKAGASCQAYNYCRGQAEVRVCTTDTGGHSWPGALKHRASEQPSNALSASQTIASFFSAH